MRLQGRGRVTIQEIGALLARFGFHAGYKVSRDATRAQPGSLHMDLCSHQMEVPPRLPDCRDTMLGKGVAAPAGEKRSPSCLTSRIGPAPMYLNRQTPDSHTSLLCPAYSLLHALGLVVLDLARVGGQGQDAGLRTGVQQGHDSLCCIGT